MAERRIVPVLPLRAAVLLPSAPQSFSITRAAALKAIEAATQADRVIFAVLDREGSDPPTDESLHSMGVLARVGQVQVGLGALHAVITGEQRATAVSYQPGPYLKAVVVPVQDIPPIDSEEPASRTHARDQISKLMISEYTRESGVRQLEREIGAVLRKLARRAAAGEALPPVIETDLIRSLLGRAKVRPERAAPNDEVGAATGMYYTPAGGDIMFVEAVVRQRRSHEVAGDNLGDVSLILTGQLGEVMRESARAALTYVTSRRSELEIPAERLGSLEVHVHVPAGAIPKDGPSAGVTIATALASALSGRKVRKDVAMTGEITLRGRVLPIGGVKEKVLGAHRAGITDIILPQANHGDVDDIPAEVRAQLTFHFVEDLSQVFELALPKSHARERTAPSSADARADV